MARQRLLPRAGRRTATAPASSSARRTPGNQALCPPQLDLPRASSAQASTESQGPWDSNYQIEDDFSWFLPGKKGDHDLKFGARYNYTELRARLADQRRTARSRFNTDLPFDAGRPADLSRAAHDPDRARSTSSSRTTPYELFAQDKWRMGRRRR